MRSEREKRLSEILDRSPVLTKFLDPINNNLNLLLGNAEPYLEAARNKVGKSKLNSVVHPIASTSYIARSLSNGLSAINTFKITELLVLVGFEVGNKDDVLMFREEILQKLGKLKVFTNGRQYLKEGSQLVFGTIAEGTKLKIPTVDVNDEWLEVYQRFFDSRDDLDLNLP